MNGKMAIGRRMVLKGAAAGAAAGIGALAPLSPLMAQAGGGTRLYVLGTQAGPSVGGLRYQTCYAVVTGEDVYVIDCGYGAAGQLVRAGLKLPQVRDLFVTHIHPDHIADLSALLYFSWYSGKESPLGIYGPTPMKQIVDDTLAALKPSVDIWLDDIGHAPLEPIEVHEANRGGAVMQDENVRVTSVLVNHPPVVPSFGYRFDTADRSIVFSGDTTPVESLARLAKGADILVHEAIYADAIRPRAATEVPSAGGVTGSSIGGEALKIYEHVIKSHTTPEDAGRIAAEAGVKTLVLAHIAPAPPTVTEMMYIEKARSTFAGEVIVAHDLMVI